MPKKLNRIDRFHLAAHAEINRRRDLLVDLVHIDPALAKTVCQVFRSDAAAAEWLLTPASQLGGKVPILVARADSGRKEVIRLLEQFAWRIPP